MFEKMKEFLLEKAMGRVLVRVSASVAVYLASGALGLTIQVDPAELNLVLNALVHGLISKLKPRKEEKPVEPAK